jgi:hypothetical protein
MLVAPSLMQFSAATGAGVTVLPDLRYRNGTIALAVSCVQQAEVACLLNDLRAVCDSEALASEKVLMEMDKAICGLADQVCEPETRLERLAKFMETGGNADELPETDLRDIGEFALAVDLGDWTKAESVVQALHDDPDRVSRLFVPLQSDFGIY